MEEFIPGQRWISSAELQMGLGTIITCNHRTVTIDFQASGETRTYARQNAPLARVSFARGEHIKLVNGDSIEVIGVSETDGLLSYTGINPLGSTVILPESQLDHTMQLNRPAERLFSGQIDKNRWFDLRYQTLQELNQLDHSELSGLNGCRTSLIPHQLYIAHEVANRYAPRVLLADEVGLGKTIEAGLILHHQLLNERAQRVLIIVPESLMHQWLVEMLRRFNLLFSIFDEQRCQALTIDTDHSDDTDDNNASKDNVFLSEQLVLCSLEFLATNDTYFQQALEGNWDLLVVDEAHHLQWTVNKSSHEYQLIEQLTQRIRGILLLTATPEQLGIESHFARLRLLDPDRFPDLESFIAEDEGYQPIAHAMEALLSNQPLDKTARQTLKETLKESRYVSKDNVADKNTTDSAINTTLDELSMMSNATENPAHKLHHAKQTLIEHMLDRHGTGRVLFRNTRATVKGFPGREVIAHPQPLPDEYLKLLGQFSQQLLLEQELEQELQQELQSNSNNSNSETDTNFSNLVLFPELLYRIKTDHSDQFQDWTQIDPRVKWLGNWLIEHRLTKQASDNGKILVITASAQNTIDLANILKKQFAIYAAVFHEGLNLIERDRAAAFFADPENGAPVLICSEIGSEGRNFQFAHQMVLFDLPLNPDLLEQRIGRLDRIGQTQNIKIHVPYLNNTAQAVLFHWYHKGLNAFEQTCPTGHNVFTQVRTQLQNEILAVPSLDATISTSQPAPDLIHQTQSLHQQLNKALHEGRDRLLEYNSCRQPEANRLKVLAEKMQLQNTLFQYMDDLFDAIGVDHEEHSEHCYIISPGEHMLNQFPGLPDDGLTITYDRSIALANEDMQFFTWDHPMVRTAMDMISSSEMGNTAMTTLDSSDLTITPKPGSLLLECLFIMETSAHETLQANRYLPATTIRIIVNEQGQDLTQEIRHEEIKQTQEAINTQTAQQIIKVKEDALQHMLTRAENLCEEQAPEILQSARDSSQETLLNEINRLQALAQVNPNIRGEEIEFFTRQLQSLETIFNSVKPRLDAMRVVIVT
ncbi:MAG: RNA polymerase-associated protein RapA [Gammaproteobacteria bacterium]|nr:RNA polymerase-associated protein RapA [Gammaproteobacteria bacterium]